jgi:hypothetical protein
VSIAASQSHIVEVVNSSVTVFDRTGTVLKRTSLAAFTGYTAQPLAQARVLFDPMWRRWVILAVAQPESGTVQNISIAVSLTANPNGVFYITNLNFKPAIGNDRVVDHMMLGLDQDAVLFTMNLLDTTTSEYRSSSAFGVSKGFLYNGIGWSVPFLGGLIGTVAPPIVLDGNGTDYFIATRPGDNQTSLRLYSFTGLGRNPTRKGVLAVPVPAYGVPRDALQTGGPVIDTGDGRFTGPSIQVGTSLWNTHTVTVESYPAPRFYEIDPVARTLKQEGIVYASSSSDDWNPALVASALGDALITWSSSDQPAAKPVEARVAGRLGTDAAGTMQASRVLATSTAARNTGTTPEPWGRWSGIAADPVGTSTCAAGKRAWAANQIAVAADNWRSSIARIGVC